MHSENKVMRKFKRFLHLLVIYCFQYSLPYSDYKFMGAFLLPDQLYCVIYKIKHFPKIDFTPRCMSLTLHMYTLKKKINVYSFLFLWYSEWGDWKRDINFKKYVNIESKNRVFIDKHVVNLSIPLKRGGWLWPFLDNIKLFRKKNI